MRRAQSVFLLQVQLILLSHLKYMDQQSAEYVSGHSPMNPPSNTALLSKGKDIGSQDGGSSFSPTRTGAGIIGEKQPPEEIDASRCEESGLRATVAARMRRALRGCCPKP